MVAPLHGPLRARARGVARAATPLHGRAARTLLTARGSTAGRTGAREAAEASLRFGVNFFPTAYAIHPAELARELEARAFESLWVAEHSQIPVKRESRWPGGAELPRHYYDVMDPFVSLAAAASVTECLLLATGIALVVQRDPIQLAWQVASLDVVSSRRVLFGVGAGWNLDEMRNHGTNPARRFGLLRERIEAMQALWTDEQAQYHGRQVDFDPVFAYPKPVQQPHTPIHVGGAFPGGMRRAVRYGDGWVPIAGRGDDDLRSHLAALRKECERVGRNPATLEVSLYSAPTTEAELHELAEIGLDRAVFTLPSAGPGDVLPLLDRLATLRAAVS